MFSIKMITFCKSANCPTSQRLLAFQAGESTPAEGEQIEAHLNICEFCDAEVEFYANYPQETEEPCVCVEMPIPLFELAEALLSNQHKDFLTLNKLLKENDLVGSEQ